jgi:hypothetical protein
MFELPPPNFGGVGFKNIYSGGIEFPASNFGGIGFKNIYSGGIKFPG